MMTENEIIEDLDSPVASLRVSAIEGAIRFGRSEKLLAVLQEREKTETDPDCRELLFLAVKKLAAFLHEHNGEDASESFKVFCSAAFSELSQERKLEIMARLTRDQLSAAAEAAFSKISLGESALVVTQILTIFSPFWLPDQMRRLVPFLNSRDRSVRGACMEVLCDHASELIVPKLPELLLSKDSRIQLLAVQFLTRLDHFEALSHLKMILFGDDYEKKVRALRLCIFISFDRVKNLLLDFVARETDIDLLKRAGLILINNPDCEVPFRLTEVAGMVAAEKSGLIKKMVQAACQNLRDSGVLGAGFNDYLAKLKNWLKSREQKKWLQQWIFLFENSPEEHSELLRQLKNFAAEDCGREVMLTAKCWLLKESTAKAIAAVIDAETEASWPADRQFLNLDESARMRFIQLWPQTDVEEFSRFASDFWLQSWYTLDLGAAILKTSLRLRLGNYVEFSQSSLKSANENLQVAAINYLVEFDPDYLTPHLGSLLARSSLKIKMAALGALQKVDRMQALSTLKAMLNQKDLVLRKAALACMIHFEFSAVRPVLSQLLETCSEYEIWHAALLLFQANAEVENLYCLFRLRSKAGPENLSLLEAAENELCARLQQESFLAPGEIDALYDQFKMRAEYETALRENPPPYARERVFAQPDTVALTNRNVILFVASAALVIFIFVLFYGLSQSDESGHALKSDSQITGKKAVERKTFVATIVPPGYKDGYLHVYSNDEALRIHAPYANLQWLKPGADIELTVSSHDSDSASSGYRLLSMSRIGKQSR